MSSIFGLYYPHVHFRDDRWLKVAALYLDGLYHLYSNSAEITLPEISRTEIALAHGGFTKGIHPSQEIVDRTADRFIAAVSGTDLAQYRIPSGSPVDAFQIDMGRAAIAAWKISPSLLDLLKETGVAHDLGGGRLAMEPGLVHAYLLMLGTELSTDLGASPLADNVPDHAAAGLTARRLLAGLREDAPPPVETEEQRSILVNLAITTVLPQDIDDCPVGKIVDFRARYAAERARFNEAVTHLVTESEQLEDIRDEQALLDHLKASYDSRIAPALADLEQALRGLRIDTVTGTMNVQAAVPTVASSLAVLALHPSAAEAAAIGFGGLALGVWTSARKAGGQRDTTLKTSPVSYLYHLEHDLNPVDLAERLRRATARFSPPESASTPLGGATRRDWPKPLSWWRQGKRN